MDPIQYLNAFRRWWKVIAASLLVALAIGWLFPNGDGVSTRPTTTYRATTYLLPTSSASTIGRESSNLQTVATLATLGEVPRRAAEALEHEGDLSELTRGVEVRTEETGFLLITATDRTAPRARLIADTFAAVLLEFLSERTLERVRSLREELARIDDDIAELDRQLAEGSDEEDKPVLEERDSLDLQRTFLSQQYSQLAASTGGNAAGFEIVEPAIATPIQTGAGLEAPQSRGVRLLLAGAIGLVLGLALALVLERFDTRIRDKERAEEAFKLPVLAEIPTIPRRRRGSVVADSFPEAPASNAFRLLAAALQLGRHEVLGQGVENGHRASARVRPAPRRGRTILVTSAVPAEGKSTMVANLAATFAESGKRVLILCCDFRHPTLHLTFGIAQAPGLSEALGGEGAVELDPLVQATTLDSVRVLSTGATGDGIHGLFGSDRMRQILRAARASADVVLIDTAPVLAVSDSTQLLPEVDGVLVVARAGKTSTRLAERTAEILAILQAPVVGIALNGIARSKRAGFGYGSYGHMRQRAKSTIGKPIDDEAAGADEGGAKEDGEQPATRDGGFPQLVRPSTED